MNPPTSTEPLSTQALDPDLSISKFSFLNGPILQLRLGTSPPQMCRAAEAIYDIESPIHVAVCPRRTGRADAAKLANHGVVTLYG